MLVATKFIVKYIEQETRKSDLKSKIAIFQFDKIFIIIKLNCYIIIIDT